VAVEQTGPEFLSPSGYSADGRTFLPFSLAVSFFFVWVYAGMGSPAGMVRVMASKSTETIRKSIFLLATYNMLIYLPLIVICVCGRAIIPDLHKTDEIIPRLTLHTTSHLPGGSLLAGLILTAPFGAVMATVSSFLVVIASGIVRDLYQRLIRPQASIAEIKRLTYAAMILVGAIAFVANINPVERLQALVVFSGSGAAAAFVVPAAMAAYWRRATAAGATAAMSLGAATVLVLYAIGFVEAAGFRPHLILGIDPIVWGLGASLISGVVVSLLTAPPPPPLVSRLFDQTDGQRQIEQKGTKETKEGK
jgi:SSS family solute:Na+ symporter/sodium/pantothenate symporter